MITTAIVAIAFALIAIVVIVYGRAFDSQVENGKAVKKIGGATRLPATTRITSECCVGGGCVSRSPHPLDARSMLERGNDTFWAV